ncbi:hypothetical protein BH11PSE13_BH11PSE13_28860 [soil metagenome]
MNSGEENHRAASFQKDVDAPIRAFALQTQCRCRKARPALAQTFVQKFSQSTAPITIAAAYTAPSVNVDALQEPRRCPDRAGHRWRPRHVANTALDDVTPGLAPLHEAGVMAREHIEALGQHDAASARGRPCLQCRDGRPVAQWPIAEVGVAQHNLAPALRGRSIERQSQIGLEGFATVEGTFRECREFGQ